MIVGAFAGLASNIVGSGIGSAVLQAVVGVLKSIIGKSAAMPTVAPMPQGISSTGGGRGGPNVDINLFTLTLKEETALEGPYQKLTNWEIKQLEGAGWDHGDKQFGSKHDLYKDTEGNVYEAAKDANLKEDFEFQPNGYNIKNGNVTQISTVKLQTLKSKQFSKIKTTITPIQDNTQPIKVYDPIKYPVKPKYKKVTRYIIDESGNRIPIIVNWPLVVPPGTVTVPIPSIPIVEPFVIDIF